MRARELLLVLLVLPITTFAHGTDDRSAFDNSLSYQSFYYSHGFLISPSELDLIDSKVPIDETHYVSPPNSLRLKWRSQTGGDWIVSLNVRARFYPADVSCGSLFFLCYLESDPPSDEYPIFYLYRANHK